MVILRRDSGKFQQSGGQTFTFQFQWEEALGYLSCQINSLFNQFDRLIKIVRARRGFSFEFAAQHLQSKRSGGEMLPQTVVKLVADAAPFAFCYLGYFFFEAFAFFHFFAQRRRALTDACFEPPIKRLQICEQPDDDNVGAEGDQRIPCWNESVWISNSGRPVTQQPADNA